MNSTTLASFFEHFPHGFPVYAPLTYKGTRQHIPAVAGSVPLYSSTIYDFVISVPMGESNEAEIMALLQHAISQSVLSVQLWTLSSSGETARTPALVQKRSIRHDALKFASLRFSINDQDGLLFHLNRAQINLTSQTRGGCRFYFKIVLNSVQHGDIIFCDTQQYAFQMKSRPLTSKKRSRSAAGSGVAKKRKLSNEESPITPPLTPVASPSLAPAPTPPRLVPAATTTTPTLVLLPQAPASSPTLAPMTTTPTLATLILAPAPSPSLVSPTLANIDFNNDPFFLFQSGNDNDNYDTSSFLLDSSEEPTPSDCVL